MRKATMMTLTLLLALGIAVGQASAEQSAAVESESLPVQTCSAPENGDESYEAFSALEEGLLERDDIEYKIVKEEDGLWHLYYREMSDSDSEEGDWVDKVCRCKLGCFGECVVNDKDCIGTCDRHGSPCPDCQWW